MISRRRFLVSSAIGLVSGRKLFAATPPSVITVYKDPGCECCVKWIKHLSANGFVVTAMDSPKMDEIKTTMGVPAAMQSCHTAVVDRYVIEGHVPADVIKKFLAEKPKALGLAAPGMPKGSPGMEMGGAPDHYNVLAFNRDGTSSIYAKR
ncbi:MAG: DUF411 domain-containing protein [Gemmatimonadaceae bacterium]